MQQSNVMNWFGWKNKSVELVRDKETRELEGVRIESIDSYLGAFNSVSITGNAISLFNEISEVAFPILTIVNRMCNGKFIIKETKTDSIVYSCDEMNRFLSNPNPIQSFDEFLKQAIIYKLITGRSFIYSPMADFLSNYNRWEMCENYYVLPAHLTNIIYQDNVRLFSAASKEDIVKTYQTTYGCETFEITPSNILHMKDIGIGYGIQHIDGVSRLESLKYPISNLIAVYEARNAIYVKRGALGAIVGKKTDGSGSVPLSKGEKKDIRDEYNDVYGITSGKDNMLISSVPIEFLRFNQSIQELMPFEETLADAVQIAGCYNVPAVIIPRKDQSTFSNQDSAEKSLYENTVIPETQAFCKSLNSFLGLEKSGLFLDVTFDHIPVLQVNAKEKAITDKMISESCKINFMSGVITLNDWISKTGGSRVDIEIYNKYIFQMSDEELFKIERFIK